MLSRETELSTSIYSLLLTVCDTISCFNPYPLDFPT